MAKGIKGYQRMLYALTTDDIEFRGFMKSLMKSNTQSDVRPRAARYPLVTNRDNPPDVNLIQPRYLWFVAILALSLPALAQEGFVPSSNPSVFMLKGRTSGGTVFYARLPKHGPVLVTQVHVLENLGPKSKLYGGYKFGPFFRVKSRAPGAFSIPLDQQIIWKDDVLDIAILSPPSDIETFCHCQPLEISQFKPGPAFLIGYPVTGRRTYPRTGRFWTRLGELFGSVEQMTSAGTMWQIGDEVVGDIDALSGNSGGPVLDSDGHVVGVIYTLKTSYNIGYRYMTPNIAITPIDKILEKMWQK
jgi:hypothetical protein